MMRIIGKRILFVSFVVFVGVILASCAGPQGAIGPVGPAGPAGPEGPQGPSGKSAPAASSGDTAKAASAEYVGSATCGACHKDLADSFASSGHAWPLNQVIDGQPPAYPFSRVPDPPEGYTWNDISYVVGGFNWKALFLDKDGYLITGLPSSPGSADYLNQYNLANPLLRKDAAWVKFHSGESNLPYNCGACHTTGFNPGGHQDNLAGIEGTWAEPGVKCEACHGPGSLHVSNPRGVRMLIDRDSATCSQCHLQGKSDSLDIQAGFIQHQDQYGDLPQGKHAVLDCVLCHDPHTGVVQLEKAKEQVIQARCEDCHFQEAQVQNNPLHVSIGITCVECHMPHLIQDAWRVAEQFTGDMPTHRMAIDPGQLHQFKEDGSLAVQISLDTACRHCHSPGSPKGTPKTDQELLDVANGYHTRR